MQLVPAASQAAWLACWFRLHEAKGLYVCDPVQMARWNVPRHDESAANTCYPTTAPSKNCDANSMEQKLSVQSL
jgi:hypothetical protein